MKKQTAHEDKKVAAKDKPLEWGRITAGFNDTLNGEKLTSSSMCMGMSAGSCEVEHEGKKETIQIMHNFGASISLNAKGRYFHLDLKKVVEYAVDNGLLQEIIDFKEAA